MNTSDIHKLSDSEIVEGISRMADTPIGQALQAELVKRQTQAVNTLGYNARDLRNGLDALGKSLKTYGIVLMIAASLMVICAGIVIYLVFQGQDTLARLQEYL
ncbi:MAG: hypothetical protein ABIG64_03975 [Candidatus Omnitrophota bacterium]